MGEKTEKDSTGPGKRQNDDGIETSRIRRSAATGAVPSSDTVLSFKPAQHGQCRNGETGEAFDS